MSPSAEDSPVPGGRRIGLIPSDSEWTQAQATALPAVDDRFDVTCLQDASAVLDGEAPFDCLVLDCGGVGDSWEAQCRRLLQDRPDLALVLVVDSTVERDRVVRDFAPTDVYVRASEPQPRVFASRLDAILAPSELPTHGTALRSLLEAVPVPVAITDRDGTVAHTNPAYKATFGLAERLPAASPEPPADGVSIECKTLGDSHSFEYRTVELPWGGWCHVLNQAPASPATIPDRPESSRQQPPVDALQALTDRQREVLETAYDGGFFERPKDANSDELAARLDITRSTFLQHLRAAERKLLDAVLQ